MKASYTDETEDSGYKSISTKDVLKRKPKKLEIPVRELKEVGESLVLGFRQEMLTAGDIGRVDTGTGLGTDFIILEWKSKKLLIRGGELLKSWVATFDPKGAKSIKL